MERLRAENEQLKSILFPPERRKTVLAPDPFAPVFEAVEYKVQSYFGDFLIQPEQGEIYIGGERYVLFKSASLSYEFLDIIKELYSNRSAAEATRIGNNFLFDIAHVLGKKDALSFHEKLDLVDPVEKLAAGPVQFAYTGWATVEILPESNPTPDDDFFLKFRHHNSFEAQSWKRAGRSSDIPVCTMSCGYSSGWCEESFGMPLTTVEIECEAMGAEHCTFIMAPPGKIVEYLQSSDTSKQQEAFEIPVFFEKKYTEDRLRASLEQKENLLHELHHRVKNNLQVISSLMNLQMNDIRDESLKSEFRSSVMRINTMARIHEMIYSDKNVALIPVEHYFRHLFLSLVQGYPSDPVVEVEIDLEVEEGFLEPDQAIPLGLILNEIAEHVFGKPSGKGGVFRLKLTEEGEYYHLLLEDQRLDIGAANPANNLGFSLVPVLCEQLEATLETECSTRGWSWRIAFKKTPDKKSRTAE